MRTGSVRSYWRGGLLALAAAMIAIMPAIRASAFYTGDTQPWQTSGNTLPANVFAATSVTNNGYVYEIGGQLRNTVYYAQLNAGGTGAWASTTSLPVNIEHASSVAYNGYIYEIGGDDGAGGSYNSVYYAKANSNGTLGAWTPTTSLPVTKDRTAAIVNNGYVYLFGGGPSTDVYYAPLNNDGTIGSWSATGALPVALEGLTAVTYNGYAYVMGGFGSGFSNAVYYGHINVNGTISSWSSTTALPTGLEYPSSVTANGFLYFLGGYNGAASTAVSYAPINADGSIGTWLTSSNALPDGRYGATSVVQSNNVYEIAGSNGLMANTVYYAHLAGFTMLPAVTSPVTATSYRTVPIAFAVPESPLSGSLRLTFSGPVTNVITLSSTPDIGPYSFTLDPKNILSNPTDILSASANTLPDGVYSVTLSYQDLAGDPAAFINVANVTIDSTLVTATPPVTGSNSSSGTSGALADTGLDLAGMQAVAATLVVLAVGAWRFRRRPADSTS